MEDQVIISGSNEQEVWPLIEASLNTDEYIYDLLIEQGAKRIELYIDIDPGGGFEGGSEITRLRAPLPVTNTFKFAIHHQGFIDTVGKFLGMQDIETGYPEFDKKVVVTTNDEGKIHELFADAQVREIFSGLSNFTLGIHNHHDESSVTNSQWLEFYSDEVIDNTALIKEIYHGFCTVLQRLDS